MAAVNEKARQEQSKAIPKYKDAKHLDLFQKNAYSSLGLQLSANHEAVLACYDYSSWDLI